MKTMHRTELIAELARSLGDDADLAQIAIDSLFGSLGQAGDGIIPLALARGERVTIKDFGTFEVHTMRMRDVLSPPQGMIRGDYYSVPEHKRAAFRPGKALRDRVKGGV